jgi:hypothetical protein
MLKVSSLTSRTASRIGSKVLKPLVNVRPRLPVVTEGKLACSASQCVSNPGLQQSQM